MVKEMLESLSSRVSLSRLLGGKVLSGVVRGLAFLLICFISMQVSQMNEKMYDFEQNKRNNLIFYGVMFVKLTVFGGKNMESVSPFTD